MKIDDIKTDCVYKLRVQVTLQYSHDERRDPRLPHLRTNLVFSVLPAPDSPETMMDWLIFRTFMSLYALSAEDRGSS